jgi:hypothetical protein
VGELWLPLSAPLTVYSDLETPARRGIQRTLHRLLPTPRWVIHCLMLAPADEIAARASRVPPLLRGADAARLVPIGVRINAWHPFPPAGRRDHLDLLRLVVPAVRASTMSGVPVGRIALVRSDADNPRLGSALSGTQVEAIVTPAEATGVTSLGLTQGRAEAARRIEPWLLARQPTATARPVALVDVTDLAVALAARSTIEDWNAAYAFPRLVVGDEDGAVGFLAGRPPVPVTPTPEDDSAVFVPSGPPPPAPDPGVVFLPLAKRISPSEPSLDGIARRFSSPVGGMLVFNPSPFDRSDVARDAQGGWHVVTDVPALGYAFVPETAGAPPQPAASSDTISSSHARIGVERDGGAITSLRDEATGSELVAPGMAINAFDHAVLADLRAESIPGVGRRLVARRMIPSRTLVSTVTAFDALPWVEIQNAIDESPDDHVVSSRFSFASRFTRLHWETAGGRQEAAAPVPRFRALRWAMLTGPDGSLFIGMDGINMGGMSEDGALVLEGGGRQVLRLQWRPGYLLPDDPWRFGFGMLPLLARATTGRGDVSLPTFGRMLDVRDPAVAVVGIKPADDGVGVIVYLMDVGGTARTVPLHPGLLPFSAAVLTDLAERDVRPMTVEPDGAILVPMERLGYAAVRLLNASAG